MGMGAFRRRPGDGRELSVYFSFENFKMVNHYVTFSSKGSATRFGAPNWHSGARAVDCSIGEDPMGEILERPQAPARHRLDVDAYYKMAEAGILTREDRVELIDGEIIDMNPIGSSHAALVKRLNRLFARAAAEGMVLVGVQDPLRLDAYNEPEPDLMLLRPRADDYQANHPGAADVLLVIEVSDSSLAYDRGRKLALYAKFGVPEVWIVDLAGAAIEIYRGPKDGAYASRERQTSGSLTPKLVAEVSVDVAALLA
jgi:Uma2 family endonuclease